MSLNSLPDQPDQTGQMSMEWFRQQWATLVRTVNPLVAQANQAGGTSTTTTATPSSSTSSTLTVVQNVVTGSRAAETVYQNQGPGPLEVKVTVTTNAPSEAGEVQFLSDGQATPTTIVDEFSNIGTTTTTTTVTVGATIPEGSYYKLHFNTTNLSVLRWTEWAWSN